MRAAIAGQTLSIGVYPATQIPGQVLLPDDHRRRRAWTRAWSSRSPRRNPTRPGCSGPGSGSARPNYARLPISYADPVLQAPGVIQVTLPPYEQLLLWNFDPEEEGTGDYPPRLDDASVTARLVTWIRLRYPPLPGSATTSAPPAPPRPEPRDPRRRRCERGAAAACGCGCARRPTAGTCSAAAATSDSRRAA